MGMEIEPATGVAATGGVIGILAMIYQGWRRVKGDLRGDEHARKQDDFRDTLIKENAELLTRCDKFAQERNEAREKLARAEVRIEFLEKEIARLTAAKST